MAKKKAFSLLSIAQSLKENDPNFPLKFALLNDFIVNGDRGHILDKKIRKWAEDQGFRTEFNQDSGADWWSCHLPQKSKT